MIVVSYEKIKYTIAQMADLKKDTNYQELLKTIDSTYQNAKNKVVSAINTEMLYAYWKIGKQVIDFEQNGDIKAKYGEKLLENLSKDLLLRCGKGFT